MCWSGGEAGQGPRLAVDLSHSSWGAGAPFIRTEAVLFLAEAVGLCSFGAGAGGLKPGRGRRDCGLVRG